MRNNKMNEYRTALIKRKSDLVSELEETERTINDLVPEYKSKCQGVEDFNIRHKYFREVFGDLHDRKRNLENEIKKIDVDLIDKKYANRYGWSDIEPYEVVEERTPNMYKIRWMKSVQTEESKKRLSESFVAGGFCGHYDNDLQEWNYTPCEDSECFTIRRHKDGNWYDVYRRKYVISDRPIKFYDFNF